MHLLFLAAGALLLAVLLLTYLTAARRRPEPRAIRDPGLSPQEADQAAALLGEALDPLGELMAHPDLGGPGFLTVQFPAGERPAAGRSAGSWTGRNCWRRGCRLSCCAWTRSSPPRGAAWCRRRCGSPAPCRRWRRAWPAGPPGTGPWPFWRRPWSGGIRTCPSGGWAWICC